MISAKALRGFSFLPAALLVAGLSACLPTQEKIQSPKPAVTSTPQVQPPKKVVESAESKAARLYYAQMQKQLLGQGLLRTDGGGIDTPFTDHMLAENFIRIALYDEYQRTDGRFTQASFTPSQSRPSATKSILRRWRDPVMIEVVFGPSVAPEMQQTDLARIKSYAKRLSEVTGHPISVVEERGNFLVHVVSEDERRTLAPSLSRTLPALTASDLQDVTQMPRATYCMVYAASEGKSGVYERAVAIVRAEHPDLLRQSCYHEEIAQGLGLANDSPYARPSIFNDDEEFALLTPMDEMLLKMLYDQSLKPGMTEAETRPLVKRLASQLKG